MNYPRVQAQSDVQMCCLAYGCTWDRRVSELGAFSTAQETAAFGEQSLSRSMVAIIEVSAYERT